MIAFALTAIQGSITPALASDPAPSPFFNPVRQEVRGWTIWVEPALLTEHRKTGLAALAELDARLALIQAAVPADRVRELQRLEIWLEREHPTLIALQYHPARKWLVEHGCDPRLEKMVHIPRVERLLSAEFQSVQPWALLHELAHSYHDQVLGFDEIRIRAVFDHAVQAKTYERVKHIKGHHARHYALTNHKEYFAEGTEAFFGKNDFYPFTRNNLKTHDPALHALLTEIWGTR